MLHLGIFAPIAGCKLELDDTLCGQRICGPWFLDFAGLIGDLEFKRDILALTIVSHEDYLSNTPVSSQHALLELIGYRQDPFM